MAAAATPTGRATREEPSPSSARDVRAREERVRQQLESLGMSLDRHPDRSRDSGLVQLGASPSLSKMPPPAVPSLRRSNSSKGQPSAGNARNRSPRSRGGAGAGAGSGHAPSSSSSTGAGASLSGPRHAPDNVPQPPPRSTSGFAFDFEPSPAAGELSLQDPRREREREPQRGSSLDLMRPFLGSESPAPASGVHVGPSVPRARPRGSSRATNELPARAPALLSGVPLAPRRSSPVTSAPFEQQQRSAGGQTGSTDARLGGAWIAGPPGPASRTQPSTPTVPANPSLAAPAQAHAPPRRSASVRVPPRVRNTSISSGNAVNSSASGSNNKKAGRLSSFLRGQSSGSSSSPVALPVELPESGNRDSINWRQQGGRSLSNAAVPERTGSNALLLSSTPEQTPSSLDELHARIQEYLTQGVELQKPKEALPSDGSVAGPSGAPVPAPIEPSAGPEETMEELQSPTFVSEVESSPLSDLLSLNFGGESHVTRGEGAGSVSNGSYATAHDASPAMSRSTSRESYLPAASSSQHSIASHRSRRAVMPQDNNEIGSSANLDRQAGTSSDRENDEAEGGSRAKSRDEASKVVESDGPAVPNTSESPRKSIEQRNTPSPLFLSGKSNLSTPGASTARPPSSPQFAPAELNASASEVKTAGTAGPAVPSLSRNKSRHKDLPSPPIAPVRKVGTEEKWNIDVAVQPLSDTVTMFGTTHTTAKYSLSGSVILSIARTRRQAPAPVRVPSPGLSGAEKHARTPSAQVLRGPAVPGAATRAVPVVTVSNPAPEPERTVSINIRSLSVTFTGYSIYFDFAGRFAGLKLVDITQQLLPEGTTVPIECSTSSREPVRYEAQFDMAVPGCLPASVKGPFGATFYTLSASMVYFGEDRSDGVASSSTSAAATPGLVTFAPGVMVAPSARTSSTLALADEREIAEAFGSSSDPRSRPKSGWLGKISRQRSLRSSGPPVGAGTAAPIEAAGEVVRQRPARWRQRAKHGADGSIQLSSADSVIIVRRCRELVAVPVARLAREDLEGIHQDPPETPRRRGAPPRMSSIADLASASPPRQLGASDVVSPDSLPSSGSTQTLRGNSSGVKPPVLFGRNSSLPDPATSEASAAAEARYDNESGHSPMRHFLHRPVLHPPSHLDMGDKGLPFTLTVSIPTHIHTGSDTLNFGIQVDLGQDDGWATVRRVGGLRLRHMELVCSQSERHSTIPYQGFVFNFPLPQAPEVDIADLPVLPDPSHFPRNNSLKEEELALRRGYDRGHLERCRSIREAGKTPSGEDRHVEVSRAIVIGPPNTMRSEPPQPAPERRAPTGSGSDPARAGPALPGTITRTRSMGGSSMLAPASDVVRAAGPHNSFVQTQSIVSYAQPESRNQARQSNRGRQLAATAWNRLAGLATAVLDAGMDVLPEDGPSKSGGKDKEASKTPHASYSFAGDDGNGVDLTKGRVKMTINLPLITSQDRQDRQLQTPVLLADFEGPFSRVRHKLKIKLGFGFGDKPLGDGDWGQALVMCVPIRFSEAPPAEVRGAFESKRGTVRNSVGSTTQVQQGQQAVTVPVLPAYTQLFREDGSRLADEGEDLPRYPGRPGQLSRHGTISGPSPASGSQHGSDGRWSLIAPSEILDDSVNPEHAGSEAAARENEQDYRDVIDEHIDLDTDLPDMEDAHDDGHAGRQDVATMRMFDDDTNDFNALLAEQLAFHDTNATAEEQNVADASDAVDRMFDEDVRRTNFDRDEDNDYDFDRSFAGAAHLRPA